MEQVPGSMTHEERCAAYPNILQWQAASGYRTKWRVVRYARPPETHLIELSDKRGRRRLFKTSEAARKVADALNKQASTHAAGNGEQEGGSAEPGRQELGQKQQGERK